MRLFYENDLEESIIQELANNGWDTNYHFEREFYNSAFDWEKIKEKIKEINHNLDEKLIKKAIFEIKKINGSHLEQNIIGFDFLIKGIKVFDEKIKRWINVKLFSNKIDQNHFGVIKQLNFVDQNNTQRIPDVVCFLNGLPIIVLELKSQIANERLYEAYKQNQSLKRQFPNLYRFNIFDFIANDLNFRYGSITADFKRYFSAGRWDKNNNENPVKKIFSKERILDFINTFSFFDNKNETKYLAGLHQLEAVKNTIKKIKEADHKGGVVWHTQGSGKSITMLFLAKAIIQKVDKKATIILITDRNSLDKQLFGRFNQASKYLHNKPVEIDSRKDLIKKLNDKKHFGIYFTTVQKFWSETGVLSNRKDIYILVDEAHRTQNNIEGNRILNKESEEFIIKYGFAKFMRDAFPNATLTGFTGTPLMKIDKSTIDIFGSYNHVYSMNESVRDKSTVPIYYESRKVDVHLNKVYLKEMDQIQKDYAKTLNIDDVISQQKMNTLLKSIQRNKVLEDPDVVRAKVKDILLHLKKRERVLNGKAMIVATSRKAAFEYKKQIINLAPERTKTTILVMTHNNKDSKEEEKMIVPNWKRDQVAFEFRKSNSIYKIAIVVNMWLTGFDVPDLDVMYIDKIIKYHNLMQAIARVNRVFKDKESGLIVDYLGIWKELSEALIQYQNKNIIEIDIIPKDIERAMTKLIDQINVMENNFVKNIKNFPNQNSKEQYIFIRNALNTILSFNKQKINEFILKSREIKRLTKICFTKIDKNLLVMSKGIQTINAWLTSNNTLDDEKLNLTIEKMKIAIEKAVDSKESDVEVKSTNINKDINEVAKLLEEEAEQIRKNNPQVAKKLLINSISARINYIKKFRPIFAKKASDELKELINRINEDEKLDELIEKLIYLAKKITNKQNINPEFNDPHLQAFFSILADDEYLKRNKNSEVLKRIAKELMETIETNITDQFYRSKKVQDKIAVKLKILLKTKYNYPPDELKGISGILIDQINHIIKINSGYFRKKKEIV